MLLGRLAFVGLLRSRLTILLLALFEIVPDHVVHHQLQDLGLAHLGRLLVRSLEAQVLVLVVHSLVGFGQRVISSMVWV